MEESCVFCQIIKGEIPARKAADFENVYAFYDREPSADTHILIVPKRHIENFLSIKKEDYEVAAQMLQVTQTLINDLGLSQKYKIVINGGEYQFVPHVHWHLLGGNLTKHP